MSGIDDVTYLSLRVIDIHARDDYDAYASLHRQMKAQGIDGMHVAQHLASMIVPLFELLRPNDWREWLDERLEEARLIASADLTSERPEFLDE